MSTPAEKIPAILAHWAELAAEVMVEEGCLPEPQARAVGRRVADRIAEDYAGVQLYVPVCFARQISERDVEVARANAAGEARDDTIRRLGITLSTYYQALRRHKATDLARRQPSLFQEPPEDES